MSDLETYLECGKCGDRKSYLVPVGLPPRPLQKIVCRLSITSTDVDVMVPASGFSLERLRGFVDNPDVACVSCGGSIVLVEP